MVQQLERPHPPGRNDPCPCGSGKKYKRCCLGIAVLAAPQQQAQDVVREARAYLDRGEAHLAAELVKEARHTFADSDLQELLLECYLALTPDEAEVQLRDWWEREHDRYSGAGLARVLSGQQRNGEALVVLLDSEGIAAPPDYWRLLSLLQEGQGDTEAAIAALEQYTRLQADDSAGWITLADLYQRAGLDDRALLALRRAGDALPTSITSRMLRLRILAESDRWREVRDLAETLLEGEYDDRTDDIVRDVRDLLARAYFVLGDFDGARRLWGLLLEEDSHNAEVCYRLANLETMAERHRRALLILDRHPGRDSDLAVLDLRLRSLLALQEYGDAALVAEQIERVDPMARVVALVRAVEAMSCHDHGFALDQLLGEPSERYRDLWYNHRLDCLARLSRWDDMLPTLRAMRQTDDHVLIRASLSCMAAGKLDLAERLLEEVENHQVSEVRSLTALLAPLRQSRRAAEVRRQQQVDEADRQRRAAESRDLRRRVRDLERHNAALVETLGRSEASLEKLLELVGVNPNGGVPPDWEVQLQHIAERAHKDALEMELQGAEQRLRSMLGEGCWSGLPEGARAALREGEWLFAAVEGEDRDYGASMLEFARGLERAYKDTIFVPLRDKWNRQPGPVDRLIDEGNDPWLGPFVRFVVQGGHLTLGSMAAALDRAGDVRRQGVAVGLLRRQIDVAPYDYRSLEDWRRTSERLAAAAEARNLPAHAGSVNRETVSRFRDLVLGTEGLLCALGLR